MGFRRSAVGAPRSKHEDFAVTGYREEFADLGEMLVQCAAFANDVLHKPDRRLQMNPNSN